MREDYKCKICRRLGEKLFLKGEKCLSPKCPLLRKPYPPGNPPKRRKSTTLSEYGKMLREKQKLKRMYLLKERHFSKIAKEVLKKKGKEDVSKLFIKRLEMKLFNAPINFLINQKSILENFSVINLWIICSRDNQNF